MKLIGKIALITGGNGVIGSTIARSYALEGCAVILVGRSEETLERTRKEIMLEAPGADVIYYRADVSKIEDVQRVLATVAKESKRLDILVTAAGVYGEIGTLEQCEPEQWLEAVRVNLFGTMLFTKYALPLLKKSTSAKIITFAGGGDGPLPHFSSYVSSKGAILRFTETVADELANERITVNAISPGLVNSGFVEDLLKAGEERVGRERYQAAKRQLTGEGGVVSPEKAAALAVWLASEKSNGLTGKNISAVWDNYKDISNHLAEIMKSDIYNWRRIKPKDRGYDW